MPEATTNPVGRWLGFYFSCWLCVLVPLSPIGMHEESRGATPMKPDWFTRILLLAILAVLLFQLNTGRYQLTRDANVFDTKTGRLYSSEDGFSVALPHTVISWDDPRVIIGAVALCTSIAVIIFVRRRPT